MSGKPGAKRRNPLAEQSDCHAIECRAVASMLKRKLIPSPLPIDMPEASLPPTPIRGSRVLFIVWLALRVVWVVWTSERGAPKHEIRLGRLLRHECERLGGLWVKAAHVIAVRTDTYPPIFCEELGKTRDTAGAISSDVVQDIIRAEVGRPVAEVFREFDVVPIATTAVGQVHIAWLHENGVKVAIKVQRPGSHEAFRRDFSLLNRIASIVRFFHLCDGMELAALQSNLEETVRVSTNYRLRTRIMRDARHRIPAKTAYVAKVFPRYCTERMMVMEYIDGVSIVDYERVRNRKRMKTWRRTNGIRPDKLQKRLIALRRMTFANAPSDFVPGPIFLLRNNRLALVDAGTSFIDEGSRNAMTLNKRNAQWL